MRDQSQDVFIVDEFSNFDGEREIVKLPIPPHELFTFMIDFRHEARWAPGVVTSERIAWKRQTKTFDVIESPDSTSEGAQFRQINTFIPPYNPRYFPSERSLIARALLRLKAAIFNATLTPNVFEVTAVDGRRAFVIETIEGALPFMLRYSFGPVDADVPSTRLVIAMEIYMTRMLRVLALIPGVTTLVRNKLRKELNEYVAALGVQPWQDPRVDYKARPTAPAEAPKAE